MNKKKFSVIALVLLVVMAISALVLAACNPDDTPADTSSDTEATEGLLISNSDFKVIGTSGDFPRSVTSWSGARLYSSSAVHEDVIAGAVNLSSATYEQYRHLWDDEDGALYKLLTADGRYGENDAIKNALMIYMPKENETGDEDYGPTAYGYTSASFSIEKNAYYKLSVDVLTYDIAGDPDNEDADPGARIYVSSATYAEFAGIDTDGKWVTYEIYIEGGVSSSSSLTVNLSLGKYSSYYSDGLTTGYAFFDNVTLEKLTDEGGMTAAEKYAKATADEKTQYEEEKNDPADVRTVATASLKLTNGGFEFGSTSIASSTAPSGWSMVRGDSAPSSDRFNGIVSLSSFEEDYADFVSSSYYIKDGDSVVRYYPAEQLAGIADSVVSRDGVMGDNVYMLSQQLMTAQGIRTSRDIVIEKNKYYILSVDVYLANIYGAGMTLRLTGSGNDIEITGIASNPTGDDNAVVYGSPEEGKSTAGWTTFTFVIHGNSYRDMSYKMEMWLGTDTPSDNTETTYTRYTSTTSSGSSQKTYTTGGTFSTGWAFIDNLTLEETDEARFDGVDGDGDGDDFTLDAAGDTTAKTLKIDLATENLFSDGSGISGGFKPAGSSSGDLDLSGGTLGIPEGFTYAPSDEDDPALVDPEFATAGSINTADGNGLPEGAENPGLPYDTESSYAFMLSANKATSFAYDSAKFPIRPNTSYRISVWVKTADIESGTGAYVYLRQSDDKNEGEVKDLASFTAVNTDELEDNNGWRELTLLVRGNADEAKELWLTLALGTGGRYAASTLTRGTVFFANMSMTEVTPADYDDTTTGTYVKKVSLASSKTYSFANGGFDNVDLEETEGLATGGVALQNGDKAGVPEDWTLSSDILGDSFVGGIVKMNADRTVSKQASSLFPNDTDFFTGLYANADDLIKAGAPSVLVLAGKDGEAFNAGFTSDSFSLSASSVCSVSVWAKAEAGTKGMIYLATEASGSERDGKQVWFEITGDGEWHRYTFNIRVGLTSVSLELGLWLGENADITGAVIGDDADAGQVTEESLASSGIIVFDSVTMSSSLTDDDFTDGNADDYSRYIDFYSDGFDTLSDSEEDRSELTDPDGWTEVVGTDQESSNTTSGVLYLDRDGGFVEMDGDYLAMFGAEFDLEDFVIDQSEVDAVRNDPEYAGMTDDEITAALKQKKYDALKAATGVTWDDILPEAGVQPDGNRILVINNTANSAFYYRSSGYTLSADKSYEISVKVYTHGIGHIDLDTLTFKAADEGGAFVELYLGSTYNNDSDPLRVENINLSEEDGWTTVTFYVTAPSENVSGVQLRLGLGTYDAEDENKLLAGYAFFDTVTFREITSAEYQAAADDIADGTLSPAFNVARTVPDAPESGDTTVDNDPEVPNDGFNLDNLWWMIPTILLGVAIVAVVIVFFVRKYKKKFVKKTDDTVPADKEDTANVARKKSNYEDFGE